MVTRSRNTQAQETPILKVEGCWMLYKDPKSGDLRLLIDDRRGNRGFTEADAEQIAPQLGPAMRAAHVIPGIMYGELLSVRLDGERIYINKEKGRNAFTIPVEKSSGGTRFIKTGDRSQVIGSLYSQFPCQ